MKYRISLISSLLIISLNTGCAGNPTGSLAAQCENGLKTAYRELDYAKASGFRSSLSLTKAASLLVAASTQAEFGKYPNCIDKVNRARAYIRASQKQAN